MEEQVFIDICNELGCAYDNEAALTAIASLKQQVVTLERGERDYSDPCQDPNCASCGKRNV